MSYPRTAGPSPLPPARTTGGDVRGRGALAALLALALGALGALGAAAADALLAAKIVFEKPDGKEAFRLDPEGMTAELQIGEDRLATYALDGARLKITLERGASGGSIEASAERDRYTLFGADSKSVERVLVREPDGDWKLQDAKEIALAEMKLRDDGYKLTDGKGAEAGRLKVKGDEKSLRDAAGTEVLETGDAIPPLAAACFQLPALTLPQKGAFAMAIIAWPPKAAPAKETPAKETPGKEPPAAPGR